MKATKSYLIFILFTLSFLLFAACSDDKEIIEEPINSELKLIADKSMIEPFEKFTVRIDVDLEILYATYDSIIWDANGVFDDGIIHLVGGPEVDERDIELTDYRLGKYEVSAEGYKNGEIISKSTVEYEVIGPRGDFMHVKWGQSKEFKSYIYKAGLTPYKYLPTIDGWRKIGGVMIQLWHDASDVKEEHVQLQITPWSYESNFFSSTRNTPQKSSIPNVNDFDWHGEDTRDNYLQRIEFENQFWHDYITELYGEPTLVYDGEIPSETTLQLEYEKRFRYNKQNGYPYEIWETPTSYIALCCYEGFWGGKKQKAMGLIIAEPRFRN